MTLIENLNKKDAVSRQKNAEEFCGLCPVCGGKDPSSLCFVKIYRNILHNPVVWKDAEHTAIWLYLMLSATDKKRAVLFKGNGISLMSGQLLTNRETIAIQLNVSASKVQRVLTLFESKKMIQQESSNKGRLITICNWLKYQQPEDDQEAQEY
ncbi:MAG: phage replisome organizer N-terminal domain-containing protein [Candidatus Riflebacteria bacterium]|nr:phage replisome organizer N-terminal domain-containing protein [Candidatus Riflebacteria bacterium]